MAVLIEGISVVVNDKDLSGADFKDWNEFLSIVPNDTVVSDSELIRVGFMNYSDAEAFIDVLEDRKVFHLEGERSKDIVIVDQQNGFLSPCDWAQFGKVEVEKGKVIAACRHVDSKLTKLFTPDNWVYERSLSATPSYISNSEVGDNMVFLRNENGVDVYLDYDSGKEVYVGRTS